jgi:hypothetical protein
MSVGQFVDELARRERLNPGWQDDIRRREEAIQTACDKYDETGGYVNGQFSLPRQHYWNRGYIGENDSMPIAQNFQQDTIAFREIRVFLPQLGLGNETAHSLIREQIEQQWRDTDEAL